MALLKPVILTLLFFSGLFFGGAMLLPSDWRVEYSLTFSQQPDTIHRFLDDVEVWQSWVPWREIDPTVRMRVNGFPSGKGAELIVTGNKIGERRMVLTYSDPENGIAYREETPDGTCEGAIKTVAGAKGTRVTWSVWGDVGSDPLQRYRIFVASSSYAPHVERALESLRRRVTN